MVNGLLDFSCRFCLEKCLNDEICLIFIYLVLVKIDYGEKLNF